MVNCTYTIDYLDGSKTIHYSCKDKAQNRKKRCIFHDKYFLKNRQSRDIIRKEFFKKIHNLESNEKIECIGYYLPALNFDKDTISHPMYFNKTTFVDKLDLPNKIFPCILSFANVIFKQGANFYATEFLEKTDFSDATSFKQIIFQFCHFHKDANFNIQEFENSNFSDTIFNNVTFISARLKGNETIFCNALFNNKADFDRTNFLSSTDFKNSKFNDEVNFKNAIFKEETKFENVTFEKNDHTIFNGNISQVSFLETKIDKMKFGNQISWEELNPKKSWRVKIQSMIYKRIGHKNFQYRIRDET